MIVMMKMIMILKMIMSTCQQRKEVNHAGGGGIGLGEERGHRAQLHRDRGVGGGPPGHGRVGLPLDV